MRSRTRPLRTAHSWRRALLGALTMMAAALPALADPDLLFSTYLGGMRADVGAAVAVHQGRTFVAGTTFSASYPVFMSSSSKPGGEEFESDTFVTALTSSGNPLYSRYLVLGVNKERVAGVAVDADGSAYIVGEAYYGGESAVVVVKLYPWGAIEWRREIYGRYQVGGMALDDNRGVYVTGLDLNEDESYSYVDGAFVWKLDWDGSTSYLSVIDGSFHEAGQGIAVDAAGNAYVTGATYSSNLPKAIQPAPGTGYNENAFVTKLDPAGAIVWSTYLGGSGLDRGERIEIAADGSVVVAGTTTSSDFPVLNALQTAPGGGQDLFVARLRPWGTRFSSSYLGGGGDDEVHDLALEASSLLLAVSSPDLASPLRQRLDPSCGAGFLAKLDATATRVLDGVCLGSSTVYGVAADSTGIALTGATGPGLPVADAWQPDYQGEGDAFAAKLTLDNAPDCSAAAASPATLWPADGRLVTVSIRGVTDLDGDGVTLALTAIHQDEFLTSPGTPDASGLGTPTARLRASRIPGGDGRVYHLRYTATDSRGGTCSGTVKVCVPVAAGGTCVDGGPRIDSTRAY